IDLAIFVDVIHLVDFAVGDAAGGDAGEHAAAIVQRGDRTAAVVAQVQVEVTVVVQVDQVLAAQPPVGGFLVLLIDNGPNAAGGGDVGERADRRSYLLKCRGVGRVARRRADRVRLRAAVGPGDEVVGLTADHLARGRAERPHHADDALAGRAR